MPILPLFLNVLAEQQIVLESPPGPDVKPASLPVPNPTKSYWIDTPGANPLAKEGADGTLTGDADVCIIGSGITGVSAAYHLSKLLDQESVDSAPLKVVILEARDFCSGATGRNGGHFTPTAFREFFARQGLHGAQEAKRCLDLEQHTALSVLNILEETDHKDAVDLVDGGHVDLLFTEPEVVEMHADYDAAKTAGVDVSAVRWLSKEHVEKTYGAPYPGVWIPGHNLWPLKLVTHLYRLASQFSRLALTLHTNTPATSVSPIRGATTESARRWNVTTPRGPIACSYVLHATNAYASHLLPHLHGPQGIVPGRGQIIATRAAVSLDELTRTSYSGNEGFEYWFPRPLEEGEERPLVVLGGGREATRPKFELYTTDDASVSAPVGEALRGFLPMAFPGKYETGREPEMEWSGIMGFTKLGDPFVGPVIGPGNADRDAYKGQYIAAGYSGHGMPRTFACAEAVAQMIVADISGQEWSPPDWLPRHFITDERLVRR